MISPQTTNPRHLLLTRVGLCLVIVVHVAMLGWEAAWNSPTIDEPAYLASGVSHWEFGRFDLCKVSPPLVRLVAAIPVELAPHQTDWGSYRIGPGVRAEHGVGRDFMVANGRQTFWLFTMARWACIPFSLIGASVCYRWSHDLWGSRSAIAALLLWCFCPNILAHGGMMTPDVGVTALSVASAYLYWRWSQRAAWNSAVIAGMVLGSAVLAKTNAVVLLPLLPALSLAISLYQLGCGLWKRLLAQVALSVVVAIYVINLGYGFEGSLERLDRYEFASITFRGDTEAVIGNRFHDTVVGCLPVPFPKAFLEGIDLQRKDFENQTNSTMTYLRGTWYNHSWWWYYLYVVAIKVPLGAWVLLLMSVALQCFHTGPRSWLRPEILSLVLPGIALFAIASSQTGFGHSLRYVLPAFPFAFIFASGALRETIHSRPVSVCAWCALAWHIASSLACYPHSLSYFNEIAGGPKNGHAHLLDGNLDWSQDLLYLEDWIRRHPKARPIHVGFWGFLPLTELQADYSKFDFQPSESDPNPNIPAGWYAISVNHLRRDFRMGNPKYQRFLNLRPVAMAGYSIYIYHVTDEDQSKL